MIQSHHLAAILPIPDAIGRMAIPDLLALLQADVQQAGLEVVEIAATPFLPQGTSAVLILKESHLAIHVWPESNKVCVDIHVCDYQQDNLPKAEKLALLLTETLTGQSDRAPWSYLSVQG